MTYEEYLAHALPGLPKLGNGKGVEWKNHKYIKKIDGRYFYDNEQIKAYLMGIRNKAASAGKNAGEKLYNAAGGKYKKQSELHSLAAAQASAKKETSKKAESAIVDQYGNPRREAVHRYGSEKAAKGAYENQSHQTNRYGLEKSEHEFEAYKKQQKYEGSLAGIYDKAKERVSAAGNAAKKGYKNLKKNAKEQVSAASNAAKLKAVQTAVNVANKGGNKTNELKSKVDEASGRASKRRMDAYNAAVDKQKQNAQQYLDRYDFTDKNASGKERLKRLGNSVYGVASGDMMREQEQLANNQERLRNQHAARQADAEKYSHSVAGASDSVKQWALKYAKDKGVSDPAKFADNYYEQYKKRLKKK